MVPRLRFQFGAVTLLGVIGLVGSTEARLGEIEQPIIYGEDDRLEVYEVQNDLLRRRAELTTVSFLYRQSVEYSTDASASIDGPAYELLYGLCADEPFLGQPGAAWCTGVLIDDDLVLTAGHCLGTSASQVATTCERMAVAFGYHYTSAGVFPEITDEDIFNCRRVAVWTQNSDDLTAPDFAIIQLDKSATPRHEVSPLRETPALPGERVAVVTHGAGLPSKVDEGARVLDTRAYSEYFSADTDTFEGASGSPVFDENSILLGIHTRGAADWEVGTSCRSAVRTSTGAEDHQVVSSPVEQLCNEQWPSERLCGLAPDCGDGVCSLEEQTDTCPTDCPPQQCGDGLCEGEEPLDCAADCDPFAGVPHEWLCPPEYYAASDGCDCDCGQWDPDCADERQEVLWCMEGQECVSDGTCADAPSLFIKDEGGCSLPGVPLPVGRGGMQAGLWLLAAGWLLRRRRPLED